MTRRSEKVERVTPAGAKLTIRRSLEVVLIEIDRIEIDDATYEQYSAVQDFFMLEYIEHVKPGSPRGATVIAGPTLWAGTCTRERETEVLRAMFDIEARA